MAERPLKTRTTLYLMPGRNRKEGKEAPFFSAPLLIFFIFPLFDKISFCLFMPAGGVANIPF
ncbi:hypothetical protein DWY22_09705 [Heyndrickxia coagulans]|jgi:hypothetical protein|nr:hypothetical protein DWY22_09705 [Heyndrickxia coagulans]RGR97488.1 hypothetical protein DWY16_10450 [Heyndrickxia coagulans]